MPAHNLAHWWLINDMLRLGPKELTVILDEKLEPWAYKKTGKNKFRLGSKLHQEFWRQELDGDEFWFEMN